jgi:hypothetical protein
VHTSNPNKRLPTIIKDIAGAATIRIASNLGSPETIDTGDLSSGHASVIYTTP